MNHVIKVLEITLLDINQLVLFYQIAKAGSYVAAAEQIGVTPSWISRQIKDIETKLKMNVLEKHYGSFKLTPEGEKLLDSVRKIVYESRIIETLIPSNIHEAKGNLRIATTTGHASVWLVKYMKNFLKINPDMRISIIGTDESLDLQAREADVAIRPFVPKSMELVHLYLLSYPLGLYASEEYLAEHGIPKKPEDLDKHQIITFSKDKKITFGDVDWHLNLGCRPGQTRTPFIQVNSSLGLTKLAQDGLGIVSLSKYHEVLKGSKLVEILPDIEGPVIDIHYVYPKKLENQKRITALGEYLVEELEKESKHQDNIGMRVYSGYQG